MKSMLMQYFGFLRRNPNATPDTNLDEVQLQAGQLKSVQRNFVNGEMVRAFITSGENRLTT